MIRISTDPIFQTPEMLDIRAELHKLTERVNLASRAFHNYRPGDLKTKDEIAQDDKMHARLEMAYNCAIVARNCAERAMWNRYRQLKSQGIEGRLIAPLPFAQ
jgi:hypothetical protein